jgi:cell division protease FtsH
MVCEWGMSTSMGPLTFGKKEEQIFLGREIAQHTDYSEDTALKIDGEVKRIVSEQYTRCTQLLTEHKQRLIDIADALLAREILDADQVRRLAYGHPLDEPPAAEIPADSSSPAKEKERPSIVPPMEPIRKPLAQE